MDCGRGFRLFLKRSAKQEEQQQDEYGSDIRSLSDLGVYSRGKVVVLEIFTQLWNFSSDFVLLRS